MCNGWVEGIFVTFKYWSFCLQSDSFFHNLKCTLSSFVSCCTDLLQGYLSLLYSHVHRLIQKIAGPACKNLILTSKNLVASHWRSFPCFHHEHLIKNVEKVVIINIICQLPNSWVLFNEMLTRTRSRESPFYDSERALNHQTHILFGRGCSEQGIIESQNHRTVWMGRNL